MSNFTSNDRLLAMFTYARLNRTHLANACRALDYTNDDLIEAMRYRYAMESARNEDYYNSIDEGCARLAALN